MIVYILCFAAVGLIILSALLILDSKGLSSVSDSDNSHTRLDDRTLSRKFDDWLKELSGSFKSGNNTAKKDVKASCFVETEDFNSAIKKITDQFVKYSEVDEDFREEFKNFNKRLSSLEGAIKDAQRQISSIKEEFQKISAAQSHKAVIDDNAVVRHDRFPSYPVIRYARLVDSLSPLGFIDAELLENDENAIYELEIQSNSTARYRLITDRDIQRSLVSTFTPYVTNGCEYEGNPMIINEIIHLDYGTLHLCDGIWCVENKARVMIRS